MRLKSNKKEYMKVIKLLNKTRIWAISSLMIALNFTSPVMAERAIEPPETHSYPKFIESNGRTAVALTKIDPTNSQVRFTIDMEETGKIAGIGVGWVTDKSAAPRYILFYETMDEPWIEKFFYKEWDDFSTYLSGQDGKFNSYTVDGDIELSLNTTNKLFYIVDFEDGTKWINEATYSVYGESWIEGKSFDARFYRNDLNFDTVIYEQVDASEKFIRVLPEPEPEPEPVTSEPEPELEPEPVTSEPTKEEKIEESPETDPIPSSETEVKTAIIEVAPSDEEKESTVTTASDPKTIDTVIKKSVTTDTDEDYDEYEDESFDELTESPEGLGETTVDVPVLGNTMEESPASNNSILYIIGGTALGAGLTWFLFSLYRKYKKDKRNL
jgi:hypothetical protein